MVLLLVGSGRLVWAVLEATAAAFIERWHSFMTNAAAVHAVILTKNRIGFSLLFLLACPAVGTLLRIYPCLYHTEAVGIGLGLIVFALFALE